LTDKAPIVDNERADSKWHPKVYSFGDEDGVNIRVIVARRAIEDFVRP
jgi:hypothetical protein